MRLNALQNRVSIIYNSKVKFFRYYHIHIIRGKYTKQHKKLKHEKEHEIIDLISTYDESVDRQGFKVIVPLINTQNDCIILLLLLI